LAIGVDGHIPINNPNEKSQIMLDGWENHSQVGQGLHWAVVTEKRVYNSYIIKMEAAASFVMPVSMYLTKHPTQQLFMFR
jgi:hypothetical protein